MVAPRRVVLLSLLHRAGAPVARLTHAAAQYQDLRLHPDLFDPERVRTEWLHPDLVRWLSSTEAGEVCETSSLVRQETREIYSFPLLSERACTALMEEVAHFASTGIEARRPNSMNNYGLILNDIGLRPSLDAVQRHVAPVLASLFPTEAGALDGHHSFVVAYESGKDTKLDMHTDDSDVTVNACLGDEFEESGLSFCGDAGAADHRHLSFRYTHARGRAVVHLGRRRHGADDIRAGTRQNLVMWHYNPEYRQSPEFNRRKGLYARESGPPDPACVSLTHDRDAHLHPTPGRVAPGHAVNAWCPPPGAEYEGFEGILGRYGQVDPAYRNLPVD